MFTIEGADIQHSIKGDKKDGRLYNLSQKRVIFSVVPQQPYFSVTKQRSKMKSFLVMTFLLVCLLSSCTSQETSGNIPIRS